MLALHFYFQLIKMQNKNVNTRKLVDIQRKDSKTPIIPIEYRSDAFYDPCSKCGYSKLHLQRIRAKVYRHSVLPNVNVTSRVNTPNFYHLVCANCSDAKLVEVRFI